MPNLSELLYYTGEIPLQLIVWSMFAGVVIAVIAGYLIKARFGAFIRKLLENEINSPEKAVTLDELGIKRTLFIKFGLKSHSNYKNLLVAITEDGKYYANNAYTDEPPTIAEQTVIKRKRHRDVTKELSSNGTEDEAPPVSELARVLQAREHTDSEEIISNESVEDSTSDTAVEDSSVRDSISDEAASAAPTEHGGGIKYSDIPHERVKFNVKNAKYYIPKEARDRAYSLYYTKSGKSGAVILSIALLIALAFIATFSGKLISGFTEMLNGIENPFSHKTL